MNRRHFFVLSLPVLVGGAVAAVAARAKPAVKPPARRTEAETSHVQVGIRPATAGDVPRMVELSDTARTQYARYSPVFWRKAPGAAEKQSPFFHAQLERPQNIALVAEEDGRVAGFVIAAVIAAPPVYAPGGPVCMVDDFAVSAPEEWRTVGQALLAAVTAQASARGAVVSVVVCGHRDGPKRAMLHAGGASIASEWYINPIP